MDLAREIIIHELIDNGDGGGGSCTFDGVYQQPSGHISGNSCQDWVDLHFPSQPPTANITANPTFGWYEIGYSIVNPTIRGRGNLGSNPSGSLTLLECFRGGVGSTLIGSTINPNASTYYNYIDSTTITTNQTYSVRVTDSESRTASASSNYRFTYPYYATTDTISTYTKQPLTGLTNSYYQVDMVAETDTEKQVIDFSNSHNTVTGIQFYNTVSGAWEWLNGSKSASLSSFTTSGITHTVQGNSVNYTRYTHNSVKTGARAMRFYTN